MRRVALGLALAVTLIGLAVLIGWRLNIAALKSVLPGLVSMKPNTALGLLLSGASLTLLASSIVKKHTRYLAAAVTFVIVLLGAVTLGEYVLDWDLGIDKPRRCILFHHRGRNTIMIGSGVVEVLLVEDNPQDLELALRAFKKANLTNRIEIARDGEEALDFLFCEGAHGGRKGEERPKGVLLDLKLPKIDGLEVLRRLKSDPRTKTMPVVVLTSSNEQKDLVESYNLGVNSYIVKPVNFESFVAAVRSLGLYWLLLNQPIKGEE
ncbi:MAG TPA: response regulator [Blastocatellia bacterium]|nr:response regulator [Blastocatellia bacterium]